MIPENLCQFSTDGERQVYKFLSEVAKPDADYIVWYTPDLQGEEPDFIIYNDTIGLIILEVKDWSLNQILEADRKNFKLFMNGKEQNRKNPLFQAQGYFHACRDAICKDGRLVSEYPASFGNPKIPINCGVVFTNINKFEYRERNLAEIIEERQIFFWDDLHPESPLFQDRTGKLFHIELQSKFPPLFTFNLTGKEKIHLKQIIFPIVRIEQPRRPAQTEYSEMEMRISALDHHQETIARRYDGGHHIFKGPSGSGKTLVLINKAYFLQRYNPKIRKILFVCFNITLVNYIKRMLAEKRVSFGKNGIEVVHFYELCDRLLEDKVEFENQDSDYFSLVLEEALENVKKSEKYDAILIDEAQDFSDDMLQLIVKLLNPSTNSLTIALDENQNIYSRKRNWSKIGVHARGRTHSLSFVYRTTRELTDFAYKLAKNFTDDNQKAESPQLKMFPDFLEFSGPAPILQQFPNIDEVLSFITKKIVSLSLDDGYLLSEIAVLYGTSKFPGNSSTNKNLIDLIDKYFSEAGILYKFASEDYRAKRSFDITSESVTVSTIHSVKGYDFAAVFIIGLDWLEEGRWDRLQIDRLVYVGVTRARYKLYLPYVRKNRVIVNLESINYGSGNEQPVL